MAAADFAIIVGNLTFSYESDDLMEPPAVTCANLSVLRGSVNVLIGPSGCGKTTLCRCLTGVIPRLVRGTICGSVAVSGIEILPGRGDARVSDVAQMAGLVMQEPDHQIVMTAVEDDIAFGPENLMADPAEIRTDVDGIMPKAGLGGMAAVNPSEMSGGEKQRLAIAGILAMKPECLVFDEPMSSLDDTGRAMFCGIVKELKKAGKTIVIAEHDYELLDFADSWILMKEGKVLSVSAPADAPAALIEDELWR
jgi:energy-coupling factor transport system ATP-binding protein